MMASMAPAAPPTTRFLAVDLLCSSDMACRASRRPLPLAVRRARCVREGERGDRDTSAHERGFNRRRRSARTTICRRLRRGGCRGMGS
jgi:hypothetical protein